ncbi:MAG: ABC transporter ATP-binding protein [Planctomycetota bacterium]
MTGYEDEVLGKAYDARLVKRLLTYVRPYRRIVVLAALALIGYSAVDILPPLLVGWTVDGPVQAVLDERIPIEEGFGDVLVYASLLGVAILLGLGVRFAHMWLTEYLGQRVMVDVRHQIFARIHVLSLRYFDRNPVGRLVTRVISDVEALNQALSSGLVSIFGDLVKILALAAILLWINWQLALWLFAMIPLLVVLSVRFRRRAREAYREVRKEIAVTTADLQESITGVRVIQSFGREGKARGKFRALSDRLCGAHVRTVTHFAIFFAAVEFVFGMAQALLIWVGSEYVAIETLKPGQFFSVWMFIGMIFEPIRNLSEQYNTMQSAMAASERIFKILDREELVANPALPAPMPERLEGAIEFENVSFAYRKEDWVLDDLSFRIEPGESVALVGATGAGKTSIISLVSRLYDVNRGRILIDGTDVKGYDKYELRSRIAVVLQDVFLFAGDVLENIRLGQESIPEERVIEAAKAVDAHRFIERLPGGYRAEVVERGATLSVGQKQLLAFARALAFDPRILILDEATSSVDTETEVLIQRALAKLLEGRTSVIIAHRLSTIQRCDRIFVMHHGELKEAGTHQELIARRGIYRKLYELQYGLGETG